MEHKLQFTEHGLALCPMCGGVEGSLPTECPGEHMSEEQQQAVMAGRLDYCSGLWYKDPNRGGIAK